MRIYIRKLYRDIIEYHNNKFKKNETSNIYSNNSSSALSELSHSDISENVLFKERNEHVIDNTILIIDNLIKQINERKPIKRV